MKNKYHLEEAGGSSSDTSEAGGCSRRESDQMTHPPQDSLSVDAPLRVGFESPARTRTTHFSCALIRKTAFQS